jgi:hypothetical protein
MPDKSDQNLEFVEVFNALRAVLAKHEAKLVVVHNKSDNYYLDTHTIGPNKHPIFFGGVRIMKGYVSYYLMPVYSPEAAAVMTAELKKHMQGKAFFNFKAVDKKLFKELASVTNACYQAWKKIGWID